MTGGGSGLGGIQVRLVPAGGGDPITTVTDGDGNYRLDGVPPGDYTAEIEAPEGYTGATTRPVTMATSDVTGVDFDLTRPGTIAGRVTDASTGDPVAGVTITVDGPDGPVTATTDDAGGYIVEVSRRATTPSPSPHPMGCGSWVRPRVRSRSPRPARSGADRTSGSRTSTPRRRRSPRVGRRHRLRPSHPRVARGRTPAPCPRWVARLPGSWCWAACCTSPVRRRGAPPLSALRPSCDVQGRCSVTRP